MVKPQVLWDMASNQAEEPLPNEYIFVIFNERGNIKKIRQSILEQMVPVDVGGNLCDFPLSREEGSHIRLHCVAFPFSSSKHSKYIDFGKIRGNPGKITRDLKLYTRKRGSLLDYIENLSRA